MSIRLIATDLDGTLLGRDRMVSQRNREALIACERQGILVVLASGRSFQAVSHLAKELGLNSPIISSNGARLDATPNGPLLMEDVFPYETSLKVYTIMRESGIFFVCYGRERLYQNNTQGAPDATRGVSAPPSHAKPEAESENDALVLNTVDDENLMRTEGLYEPLKYVAFAPNQMEALQRLKKRLAEETDCAISSSWFDNVEVLVHGAGKGKAIERLCAQYAIRPEETMAFGDNLNDLDMLRSVGVPVAMENAIDEVKHIARIIAPHHDESGAGRVIEERVLGIREGA